MKEKIIINGKILLVHPQEEEESPPRKIDEFALRPLFEPPATGHAKRKIIHDMVRTKTIQKRMPVADAMEVPESMMTIQYVRYKKKAPPRKHAYWNISKTPTDSRYQRIKEIFYPPQPHPPAPIHTGFSESEKLSLMAALQCCVVNSNRAFNAAAFLFEEDLDKLKLWFGSDDHETIRRIVEGIYKINKVISDDHRILTFIDMRHQREGHWFHSPLLEPAPGLSTCYGKSSTDFISEKDHHDNTFQYDYLRVPDHLPSTGMRILIGEHMLQPTQSVENRALIIYHELTHKILGTIDKGLQRRSEHETQTLMIFGAENAKRMAKDYPHNTLLIADCWAYFVASFGQIEPTQ